MLLGMEIVPIKLGLSLFLLLSSKNIYIFVLWCIVKNLQLLFSNWNFDLLFQLRRNFASIIKFF